MAIYVVIGVFILASSLILISYRSGLFASAWERERAKSLLIPEQAKQVQNFVLGCLERVGREGLDLLGSQGGYISLPDDGIPASPVNPFSNRLNAIGDLETAYWVYVKPNGVESKQVPTEQGMEEELEGYVEGHLRDCTGGFEDLPGFEIGESDITADVDILDETVLFSVIYPLEITSEDFSSVLSKFYTSVDVELGRLHKLGMQITNDALRSYFLEEKTMDFLSLYEEIPFAATEIECKPRFWRKGDVVDALQEALQANIPAIKLGGTDFALEHEYFLWDASFNDASGLRASLLYLPSWPMKMDVEPSDGDLLIAEPILPSSREGLAFVSGLLCLQDYKFVYDLQYPVLFVLSDASGYSLQFAYLVVVDNNQPRENKLGAEGFQEGDERICRNLGGNYLVNVLSDEFGSLGSLDAELSFRCVSTECDLGKSSGGKFIGKLPQCVNGVLLARKDGYHEGEALIGSTLEGGVASVVMPKVFEIPVSVQYLDGGFLKGPTEGSEYFVVFSEKEKDYSFVLTSDDTTAKLIPGSYDVTGYVMLHSDVGFTIEGKDVEHCLNVPRSDVLGVLGVSREECVSATVPDTEVTDVLAGGMEVGWNVDSLSLSEANELEVFLPVYGVPSTFEEMSEVYSNIQTSLNAVEPRLR